ncbi:MAG: ribonuclease P protein component 1 [Acidilobus sp.]
MRITEGNIPKRTLIGLKVKVLRHPDPGIVGLEGVVVWETAKTFVIRRKEPASHKDLRILKDGALLEVETEQGVRIVIEGFKLLGRPEERVKKSLNGPTAF